MEKGKIKIISSTLLCTILMGNIVLTTGCNTMKVKVIESEPVQTTITDVIETSPVESTSIVTTLPEVDAGLTMEDVMKINDEFQIYLNNKFNGMEEYFLSKNYEFKAGNDVEYDKTISLVFLANYEYISDEEKTRMIDEGIISSDMDKVLSDCIDMIEQLGYCNGSYPYYCRDINVDFDDENLISLETIMYDKETKENAKQINNDYIYSLYYPDELSKLYLTENRISEYEIDNDSPSASADYILKGYDNYSRVCYVLQKYSTEELKVLQEITNNNYSNFKAYVANTNTNSKQKVLTNE